MGGWREGDKRLLRKPCGRRFGHARRAPHLRRTKLPASAQSGRSSGVEHNLAKVGVEGSNPFARSNYLADEAVHPDAELEREALAPMCARKGDAPWPSRLNSPVP